MKALIFGAGKQGRVAGDYLASKGVAITYADINLGNLEKAKKATKKHFKTLEDFDIASHVGTIHITDSTIDYYTEVLEPFDVVFSSAVYTVNYALTRAAIAAKTHLCDLGGSNEVVYKQFGLSGLAEQNGVAIIPDCGLAPGMSGLLAAAGIEEFGGEADEVNVRVGGIPLHPNKAPLNYMIVFSVQGLLNEYLADASILKDGLIKAVPSLADCEDISFDGEQFEAFNTSGGISTLPNTYMNKVKRMDYKTIRYPGHCAMMNAMKQIGLFSDKPENSIVPRTFVEGLMDKYLASDGKDRVLIRASIEKDGEIIVYEVNEKYDEKTGHSAMGRTTSYSAAIIVKMLGEGKIAPGVWEQEKVVPLKQYIDDVKDAGINIKRFKMKRK